MCLRMCASSSMSRRNTSNDDRTWPHGSLKQKAVVSSFCFIYISDLPPQDMSERILKSSVIDCRCTIDS